MKDGKAGGIIVVSDTHIGSEQFNHDDFCDFLEWVASLSSKPRAVSCKGILDGSGNAKGSRVVLRAPGKLVLLGDILEFWDPICHDRDFALTYGGKPFSLLEALPCEKVYVIGNHDEDLCELHEAISGGSGFDKCRKPCVRESMESVFLNRLRFEIYNRHYPPKDRGTGIAHGELVGRRTYFFLHGHQFDKWQVFKGLSDLARVRIDPIDYFQDLVNVSFAKELHRSVKAVLFFALAFGLSLYVYLFYKPLLSDSLLVFVLYLLLASFVLTSLIPTLVTSLQRKVWDRLFKVKDKTAQEVVEGSFTARQDRIDADVVVFGHTHFAGTYLLRSGWKLRGLRRIKKLFGLVKPEEEGRQKFFVNTGCWVGRDRDGRKVNTFAYIDRTGIYLFKWNGKGAIECIGGFSSADCVA